MPINPTQNVQQAKIVPGEALRPGQTPVQLELFDQSGNPWNPENGGPIEGFATEEYVDNAVENLASESYVDDAINALRDELSDGST